MNHFRLSYILLIDNLNRLWRNTDSRKRIVFLRAHFVSKNVSMKWVMIADATELAYVIIRERISCLTQQFDSPDSCAPE